MNVELFNYELENLNEIVRRRVEEGKGLTESISYQDEATELMIGIRDLHDGLIFYMGIIIIMISYNLWRVIYTSNEHRVIDHMSNATVEFLWTIIPAFILILIGIPSIKLLYSMNEVLNPLLTLKVIGNQWYWSYELYDILNFSVSFSSYLNPDYKLFKYLETDAPLYLPFGVPIRIITTSNDVIHSWAVPSLGIKLDCIPGRLNEGLLYMLHQGLFFGQCSELCGLGHAYMPIQLYSVDQSKFLYWISIL